MTGQVQHVSRKVWNIPVPQVEQCYLSEMHFLLVHTCPADFYVADKCTQPSGKHALLLVNHGRQILLLMLLAGFIARSRYGIATGRVFCQNMGCQFCVAFAATRTISRGAWHEK